MTIAGHPGDDWAPGTLNSIIKQAQLKLIEDKLHIPESKSFAEYIAVAEKPGMEQTA